HPPFHPLRQGACRVHRLSHLVAVYYIISSFPQHRFHPPHPPQRLCRPYHRDLRQLCCARQLRRRPGHFLDSGPDQFYRHHQGRRPHRRSRRPFHPGRHARQADGGGRRTQRRHDQRNRGPPAPPQGRAGSRFLRGHGRREQVCPRRRHRRHSHHPHQCPRRFCHRHH